MLGLEPLPLGKMTRSFVAGVIEATFSRQKCVKNDFLKMHMKKEAKNKREVVKTGVCFPGLELASDSSTVCQSNQLS